MRDYETAVTSKGLASLKAARRTWSTVLHRLLWLATISQQSFNEFPTLSRPDTTRLQLVAQRSPVERAVSKGHGTSERERNAIQRLLASWKHLTEDNLFRRQS